jgi:hypothetical protein
MRTEYDNTYRDFVTFQCAHQFASPVVQVLIGGIALLIFAGELPVAGFPVALVSAATWYAIIWVAQFIFTAIYVYSRNNKAILTRHVVEVRDEGLYEETTYNQSLFFWPGVVKIVRRLGCVAVYVTPHFAHIIPVRAFSSTSQINEFVDAVRVKLRAI